MFEISMECGSSPAQSKHIDGFVHHCSISTAHTGDTEVLH